MSRNEGAWNGSVLCRQVKIRAQHNVGNLGHPSLLNKQGGRACQAGLKPWTAAQWEE